MEEIKKNLALASEHNMYVMQGIGMTKDSIRYYDCLLYTSAYDPLHWPDWGLGQYNALNIDGEIMGDNFWVGGATKTDMQNWHMLFNYEANENNTLGSLWTVDYSGIKRCKIGRAHV